MTYDKLIFNIPPYQQGNRADFEFTVDVNFPIETVSDISFVVVDINRRKLMTKTLINGDILLTDRTVHIDFTSTEMKAKSGQFIYEIDFIDLESQPFATIGGKFIIESEYNTR